MRGLLTPEMFEKFRELFMYGIIGVLTTAVSFLSYTFFTRILDMHYMLATVLSFVVALLFAFVTNRKIVFRNNSSDKVRQMFLFTAGSLIGLAIDAGIMFVGVDILHVYDLILKGISFVLVAGTNYIFRKFVVFRRQKVSEDESAG